jgi:hypothetical protein
MLRGRFGDTSGRPYLEGRLVLPRLNIAGDVSFLVDTGADTSVLHPADAMRMRIDFGDLTGDISSVGVGGTCHHFSEEAALVFAERRRVVHFYFIELAIAPPDPGMEELPSLLGRDILDRWRMTYSPSNKYLGFKVLSADHTEAL